MPKLIISVSNKELDALVKLALSEMRNPREQLRFILHQSLLDHQLLDDSHKPFGALNDGNGSSIEAMRLLRHHP
jgi:hypothetical protein